MTVMSLMPIGGDQVHKKFGVSDNLFLWAMANTPNKFLQFHYDERIRAGDYDRARFIAKTAEIRDVNLNMQGGNQ